MEIFVKTIFWIHVVALALNLVTLAGSDYPRTKKVSVGSDLVSAIIIIGLGAWSGFLVYWR